MKKYLALPTLLLVLACSAATASAQSLKVGTVDMKRVFDSYYKTKDAEAKINEQRNIAKKELEERVDVAKKASEELGKLDQEVRRPELSNDAREQKVKVLKEKDAEMQNMKREIQEFQASREKQLQEQTLRMRGNIVDDINKVVSDKVKAESFDIVLDKSGASLNGVLIVLYSRDSYEFTDSVITTLNKNKGSAEAPAAAPTAPAKRKAN